MKKNKRKHYVVSNEEAHRYANGMIRNIQNSVFSSLNANQNVQSDMMHSKSYERWCNHSDGMNGEWLNSNSSFQGRNYQCFDASNVSQNFENDSELENNNFGIAKKVKDTSAKMYCHNGLSDFECSVSVEAKLGMKCPKCCEINSPKSNWCMECGKALTSVEVRRYNSLGEPCDKVVSPSSYDSRSAPIWNELNLASPPKFCSFKNQIFTNNTLCTKMEKMNLNNSYQQSNMLSNNQDNGFNRERISISFDFDNPQFDDYQEWSQEYYPKNHAVYRRASHDENAKDKEGFYPFDDLLYPEFAIYDPNLGHTFPSSNIVSNGIYYEQTSPQLPMNASDNHKHNSNRNKKFQHNSKRNRPSRRHSKNYKHKYNEGQFRKNTGNCKDYQVTIVEKYDVSYDETCYWNLPDELIFHIFSFLAIKDLAFCSRVCKNFNRLAGDGNLWKNISLKKYPNLNNQVLAKIAKKKPASLSLIQCNGKHLTMDGLRNLFQSCADSLKKLDISCSSGGVFTGENVLLLAFRCKNVRVLDVSWSNVSTDAVESMSVAVHRLTNLALNGCQMITDKTIEAVVSKHGESLESLEMFGCFKITPMSIDLIGKECRNIRKLNVGQCHKISNSAVSTIARTLTKLETLDLRGCKSIRDFSLRDIVSKCKQLTTLIIANCPFVTNATLVNIALHLPTLQCLDACGCGKISDGGLISLAKGLKNLKMLDVSSTSVTSKSVYVIASASKETLISLKLSFCLSITERCLRNLVSNCKRLETLHLYGCKSIKNLTNIVEINPNVKIERESLR